MDPKQYIYHRLETNQKFKITFKSHNTAYFRQDALEILIYFPTTINLLPFKFLIKSVHLIFLTAINQTANSHDPTTHVPLRQG